MFKNLSLQEQLDILAIDPSDTQALEQAFAKSGFKLKQDELEAATFEIQEKIREDLASAVPGFEEAQEQIRQYQTMINGAIIKLQEFFTLQNETTGFNVNVRQVTTS